MTLGHSARRRQHGTAHISLPIASWGDVRGPAFGGGGQKYPSPSSCKG